MKPDLTSTTIPDIADLDFSGFAEEEAELELLDEPEVLEQLDLTDRSARHLTQNSDRTFDQSDEFDRKASTSESTAEHKKPLTHFRNRFLGYMDLYASAETVAKYLDAHQGWFCRCARPMKAESIGENAYALGIGGVGSLGYKVDPRIGLDLLPGDRGAFRIVTVPIPGQAYQGYDVDFQAVMELTEKPGSEAEIDGFPVFTSVEWQLDLTVTLQFPKFIHAFPQQAIQNTGDTVLSHIVKTISNQLTKKVQEDFHQTMSVNLPKKSKSLFPKISLGKGSNQQ